MVQKPDYMQGATFVGPTKVMQLFLCRVMSPHLPPTGTEEQLWR